MLRGWISRGLVLTAAIGLASCAIGPKRASVGAGGSSDVPGHVMSRYQKALDAMLSGDDAKAIQRFEDLISAYPQYAGPHVNLGIIHARNERGEEAEQMFERAIEVNPAYPAAYNELGILYRQQGRFEDAVEAYLGAIGADPEYALAYLNLGVLYDLYQRQPQTALEYYQQYLQMHSDEEVERWTVELQRRIAVAQRSARAGDEQ
jgi:tetratricopeptide (TPR) repeat protein